MLLFFFRKEMIDGKAEISTSHSPVQNDSVSDIFGFPINKSFTMHFGATVRYNSHLSGPAVFRFYSAVNFLISCKSRGILFQVLLPPLTHVNFFVNRE